MRQDACAGGCATHGDCGIQGRRAGAKVLAFEALVWLGGGRRWPRSGAAGDERCEQRGVFRDGP